MKNVLLSLLTGLLLSACASVHQGEQAPTVKGEKIPGLVISAREIIPQEAEAFAVIAVTIENKTDEWLRVQNVDLLIDSEAAKSFSIVRGKDLIDWASAMNERSKLERYNSDMTKLGFAAAGLGLALAGAAQNNQSMSAAGSGMVTGTYAWIGADAINYARNYTVNPKSVPDDYLTTTFSVPARMFLRRWILVNKPVNKRIAGLPLKIKMVDGRTETVMADVARP